MEGRRAMDIKKGMIFRVWRGLDQGSEYKVISEPFYNMNHDEVVTVHCLKTSDLPFGDEAGESSEYHVKDIEEYGEIIRETKKKAEKAILVLDEMPENCTECPACNGRGVAALCRAAGKQKNTGISGRPYWRPLRKMPGREQADQRDGGYYVGWTQGWNDALRAIEGSGEDG